MLSYIKTFFTRGIQPDPFSDRLDRLMSHENVNSATGIAVNDRVFVAVPAINRAIDLVASHLAALPLNVLAIESEGKEKLDNSLSTLLKHRSNPYQSAFQFKKQLQVDKFTAGNGYAWIDREGGKPVSLWRLSPMMTEPEIDDEDGELYYKSVYRDRPVRFHWSDVLHVKGLSTDGIKGLDPKVLFANQIGTQIAASQYTARFFRNGAIPAGWIKVPKGVKPDQVKEFRDSWQTVYQGVKNGSSMAVMPPEFELHEYGFDFDKIGLKDLKEFGLIEAANIIGVMPGLLGSLVNTSYASQAQDQKQLLANSVNLHLHDWEGELNNKLLSENQKERGTHVIEFDRKQLENTDLAAVVEILCKQFDRAVIDTNEFRKGLQLAPVPDGQNLRAILSTYAVADQLAAKGEAELEKLKEPPAPAPNVAPEAPSSPVDASEPPETGERSASERLQAAKRATAERMAARLTARIEAGKPVGDQLSILAESFRPFSERAAEQLGDWLVSFQEEIDASLPEQVTKGITEKLLEVVR
jgi:HK97 family phage portal protein